MFFVTDKERYLKSARQMITNEGVCSLGGGSQHIYCRDCFYQWNKPIEILFIHNICGGSCGRPENDRDRTIASMHIRDAKHFITKDIPVHIELEDLE